MHSDFSLNTNPTFGKNRTHDFRISRCADYLLLINHSGDEGCGGGGE